MRVARRLLIAVLLVCGLLPAGDVSFAGDNMPLSSYAWPIPVLTLPAVLLAFGVGVLVQRRWPSSLAGWCVRLLLAVAVTAWIAGVSSVVFALTEWGTYDRPGWSYSLLLSAMGAAQLAAGWWAEDALARKRVAAPGPGWETAAS